MGMIPLDPFADGKSATGFILIPEEGRCYYELVVADEDGRPLAPRIRIENNNGELHLFVWDANSQGEVGPHSPPYSQSIILARAEPSAAMRLFGLLPASSAEASSEPVAA
jgi:hypothetical protein